MKLLVKLYLPSPRECTVTNHRGFNPLVPSGTWGFDSLSGHVSEARFNERFRSWAMTNAPLGWLCLLAFVAMILLMTYVVVETLIDAL